MVTKLERLALLVVATLVAMGGVAYAAAPVTTFYASVQYGTSPPRQIMSAGPLAMPYGLSEWSCQVTENHVSDDGRFAYRNIACERGVTIMKISAACRIDSADADGNAMVLSKVYRGDQPATEVQFRIACVTKVSPGASL